MTQNLYAWGKGEYGQTGLGTTNSYYIPQRVNSDGDWSKLFANKSQGWAIKTNNKLYYSGVNSLSGTEKLFGETSNNYQFNQVGTADWSMVVGLKDQNFDLNNLRWWSVGLKTNGTLWFAGVNAYGTRGDGNTGITTSVNDWVQIGSATDWAYIAGGRKHVVAIKTNGDLYTWGTQEDSGSWLGYLGNNSDTNLLTPTFIASGYTKCWASRNTTWAMTSDGSVYTCGKNDDYVIRSGGTEGTVYKTLGLADSTKFTDISVGGAAQNCALGIDTSGRAWKMGGIQLTNSSWVKVTGVATSGQWTRLTSTTNNSKVFAIEDNDSSQSVTGAVLKSDGSLITFGGDSNLQLARNSASTPYPSSNTAFDSLTTAVGSIASVAGGDSFFLALIEQPVASFTTSKTNETTVVFTNTSTNATSYTINWGDGTSNTVANNSATGAPGVGTLTHVYATASSDTQYTITLTAQREFVTSTTLNSVATTTFNSFVTQSPTFTVVEQGLGPTVIVRNTTANTLGATSIFGAGNKWRWDWGDGTYTDVNSGGGLPGDRLVNLGHLFTFTAGEIAAASPVSRTITLRAYNGHPSSPFSSSSTVVSVIPVNVNFPNVTFTTTEDADIPAIFNAPKNITWGSST